MLSANYLDFMFLFLFCDFISDKNYHWFSGQKIEL